MLPSPWSVVCDGPFDLAEAPLWRASDRALLWSDIDNGSLWRVQPDAQRTEASVIYRGRPVGGFTEQADGSLLVFRDAGNVAILHADGSETAVISAVDGEEGSRFNDVIADPAGRVFCGTLTAGDKPGRLYRLDGDGSLHCVAGGFGTPNGMGFTPDGKSLYVTDSRALTIWRYAYDVVTGALGTRSLFYRSPTPPARPDGLCVDAEGCVWTAQFEGGVVLCLAPDGTELRRVEVPARYVTSLCFGPAGSDSLFVTSARGAQRPAAGVRAGAVFRLPAPTHGGPVYSSRITTHSRTGNAS